MKESKAEIILRNIVHAIELDADGVLGTYIQFKRVPGAEMGVTQVWGVASIDPPVVLGYVKWFGPWRKYGFYPESNTIYEETCLREVACFCEALTRHHREKRKATRQYPA